MQIRTIRAALLAAVTAIAVVVPTAAQAQTQTLRDSASDTWTYSYDEATDTLAWEATGTQPDVDVAKQVIQHGHKSVTVTTVYRNLDLTSDFLFVMSQLRTNQAKYDVTAGWSEGSGDATLSKKDTLVKCRGLKLTVSKKQDRLTTVIPRSCLKDPTTVQLKSVAAAGFSDPEDPDNYEAFNFYGDPIGEAGHGNGVWSKNLKKG